MRARDIPNLITVGRFLLVPPVVWVLLQEKYSLALLLFFIAGASDGLDGYLAKRFDWTSRLGALLDPLADKALLVSCYAVLTWSGLLPVWLLVLVLLRDLVIVCGAVIYHFYIARLDAEPTLISKTNTLMQILLVLLVIVNQGFQWGDQSWVNVMVYVVTVTTVWSGIDYVVTWGRRARDAQ